MIAGVGNLLQAYRAGHTTPLEVIDALIERRGQATPPIWITQVPDAVLREQAGVLAARSPDELPLYGVPFAIKDNIDLAGVPTTAACDAYRYLPQHSASVVRRLVDAGAIPVGKTNLDQFATGLVGTRSPWGAVPNAFDPDYISGGSSSGSAVAVALGLAAFALGTDTAGSGRVPAAFNNIVGYKPTLGLLSTQGVVPACRSLDAVSIFALTAADARLVSATAAGFDASDPFARQAVPSPRRGWSKRRTRIGVPRPAQREFHGDAVYAALYTQTLRQMSRLDVELHEVDIAPLLEVADLLYQGPWVAERHLTAGALIDDDPSAVLPEIRQIIGNARRFDARDAFAAQYRLRELQRQSRTLWEQIDALLLPTAPTHYRIAEVLADPIALNSRLGHYTNFVNLLDLAAVAVPAGFTAAGLPFGVTLIAPAHEDDDLLWMAARWQQASSTRLGALDITPDCPAMPAWEAGPDWIDVAVCGAHMSGLPLNPQLTGRGAVHVATTRTTADYRLYALPGGPPARPGLLRVPEGQAGAAIDIEIWRMPVERFGDFLAGIPAPLAIGRVRTREGRQVAGFVCESAGVVGAVDITATGGWRNHLARLQR